MFGEKSYKNIIKLIFQLVIFVLLLMGNVIEFITFFTVTGSFTFLEMSFPQASMVEFCIALAFSMCISLVSILLIRSNKLNHTVEYSICITLITVNILKLIYFIPSLTLDKKYFFYLLKQFIPLVTNTAVIFFGFIQLGEIKYTKYRYTKYR
ncbi:MAG: hypothetical protein ACOWWR_14945 [Eubacteriales bacterium]